MHQVSASSLQTIQKVTLVPARRPMLCAQHGAITGGEETSVASYATGEQMA